MSRIVYVNGDYVAEEEARVSVFDRGFLMADAVYEVTSVLDAKLADWPGHCARLGRSLTALKMAAPCSDADLLDIHRELVRRNNLVEGLIYLQVTRGAADRDFAWPKDVEPGIVLFTQDKPLEETKQAETGISIVPMEDLRWGRRDIKTTQLLYPSFAKMAAKEQGADDAWLTDPEGFVNEGTSNNAYIITKQGEIVTRQLSHDILHGITRATVLELAAEAQMKVVERPFTIAEAQDAAEAFITAASTFVCPVVKVDGVELGDGKPGAMTKRLREIYIANAKANSI
ncbi:MAG: D-amino-acid transaminase [Pseudomonadota bacterium]